MSTGTRIPNELLKHMYTSPVGSVFLPPTPYRLPLRRNILALGPCQLQGFKQLEGKG